MVCGCTQKGGTVYQPKIREDLIPRLYHLAKAQGVPMTRLVSELLEAALQHLEREGEAVNDPPAEEYHATFQPSTKGEEP